MECEQEVNGRGFVRNHPEQLEASPKFLNLKYNIRAEICDNCDNTELYSCFGGFVSVNNIFYFVDYFV